MLLEHINHRIRTVKGRTLSGWLTLGTREQRELKHCPVSLYVRWESVGRGHTYSVCHLRADVQVLSSQNLRRGTRFVDGPQMDTDSHLSVSYSFWLMTGGGCCIFWDWFDNPLLDYYFVPEPHWHTGGFYPSKTCQYISRFGEREWLGHSNICREIFCRLCLGVWKGVKLLVIFSWVSSGIFVICRYGPFHANTCKWLLATLQSTQSFAISYGGYFPGIRIMGFVISVAADVGALRVVSTRVQEIACSLYERCG